jgi:hypothetical protein
MLWPMATTDYLRRTGGVPAAGWRRANSWWTHIYWESTMCTYGMHLAIAGRLSKVSWTHALPTHASKQMACMAAGHCTPPESIRRHWVSSKSSLKEEEKIFDLGVALFTEVQRPQKERELSGPPI